MEYEEFINSCDINHLLQLKDKQTLEINIRSFACQAAIMARKEERERAFKVLESVLERWCQAADIECILDDFKAKLEAKQ